MSTKPILDIFWILSSLSFFLFFYLITETSHEKIIRASLNGFCFDGTYFVFLFLLILPLIILAIFKIFTPEDETLNIETIKPAEINYIPTYIGYFVIATSINNMTAFFIVSVVIAILIKYTRMFYFNPTLLFVGYKYYEVVDTNGTTISLITKNNDLKNSTKLTKLRRLNNYTFIDGKEECDD